MKNTISLFTSFLLLSVAAIAQPTGYLGQRQYGANMTNQWFVYNSPGVLYNNSRLVAEFRDSAYARFLYNTFRIDYLGSSTPIYIKTDASGNLIKAPITDIFNASNYYTKTASDGRYLQTESDPKYIADSSLLARKANYYTKAQSDLRYLQSFTESDPIFSSSPVFGVTSANIYNWNTAFSWGNHAGLYPLLSGSYSNPSWITSLAYSKITGVPSFLTIESDPVFSASASFGITSTLIGNWNTAFGWGNHALAGYVTASSTNTFTNKSGNISQWTNNVGYLTSITSSQVTSALGYTPINPNGTTGQYFRGDGSLAAFPTIPAGQVNADWNASSGVSSILNKPTIPTNTNQLTNGAGFITNLSSFTTSNLSEGSNLYYTDTRARSAISITTTGSGAASYSSSTGVLNIPNNAAPGASTPPIGYGTGTGYDLTTTSAKIDFTGTGSTDPSITLTSPGTYLILSNVSVDYVALTTLAVTTCNFKVRRTNNTAADLTNAFANFKVPVITLLTQTAGDADIQAAIYTTTNSNDVLELWANRGAVSVGSIRINQAWIAAIRIY